MRIWPFSRGILINLLNVAASDGAALRVSVMHCRLDVILSTVRKLCDIAFKCIVYL